MFWFWMNIPAAVVFFALGTGIPMWLILRHPDRGPAPLVGQSPAAVHRAVPAEPQLRPARRYGEHPVAV